ncbi:MAG: ABC transporter ATP-binding protein [Deltaproteobacteria bacterium]|nr:ABC transporter ATP-binding protein [Candidatus Zymogenaceae bacterium]
MEYAAVVKNLTRTFGDFTAVDRVSFRVQTGEIFGFLGPNGAGKSTTIRMLNGILMPTSGDARILGFDVYTQVEEIKANIGYMSQRFSLYDDLTVMENIEFYGGIYRVPKEIRKKRYRWALQMAGLSDKKDSLTGTLPIGWKQRLALGCAVLHEPRLLFLDEPTSGVDPASRRDFWELIGSMAENGTTVFVTTHYMDEAEHCDRLGLIYKGRLITIGTPEELKKSSMPGTVLEVRSDRVLEVMETVEGIPGVLEAAVFGRNMHVVVDDPVRVTSSIKKVCADRDIDITGIEAIDPSLEDVFVSLIYKEDMTNGVED